MHPTVTLSARSRRLAGRAAHLAVAVAARSRVMTSVVSELHGWLATAS